MASKAFAEAFARLSTSDSRLNALEALVNELTPYEWRFVQALTSTRTFQFDIVGRLPVELVSHVFSFLDTSTPWRLQHVCRAWHERMQSLLVIKTSLDHWYDGTLDLKGVDLDFCRRKARSIHALRSGRALPDSSLKISTQLGLTHRFLVGDNLIWLAEDRRQVNVVHLRSLTNTIFVDPSRGEIGDLYAADDLVVFSARLRGVVFVGKLNRPSSVKSFRIHGSTTKLALTCRHGTVACAMYLENHTLVYIWDYETSQGRSFSIDRAALHIPMSNQSGLGLLLQPNTETITFCQFALPSDSGVIQTSLLHWRFTYTGECLRGVRQVLEGHDDESEVTSSHLVSRLFFVPASHDGLYMVQCDGSMNDGSPTIRPLQYDEQSQSFTIPHHLELPPTDPSNRSNLFWWKDVFVAAGTKDEIIAHRITVSAPNVDPEMAHHVQQQRLDAASFKDILVNDLFIVRPYRDAFFVFCYDHTVHLPGKEGTLRGTASWEAIESEFSETGECM